MTASKRQYRVVEVTSTGIDSTDTWTLEQITYDAEDAPETAYAMQDIIDEILDLKVSESMYFQPSRDDENSKGIIVRIR